MKQDPYRLSEPDRIGAHIWAALAAGLFSILAHAALALFLEKVPLRVWQSRSEQQERIRERSEQSLRLPPVLDITPPATSVPQTAPEMSPEETLSPSELVEMALPPASGLSILPDAPAPHPEIQKGPADAPETDAPAAPDWVPRQDILEITDRQIEDTLETLPRWETYAIERTVEAPDYAPAVPPSKQEPRNGAPDFPADAPAPRISAARLSRPKAQPYLPESGIEEFLSPAIAEIFPPPPEIDPAPRAIEQYLRTEVRISRPSRGEEWRYFEIRIDRLSETSLPVTPKDLLIIQDASASLAEERLFFCRRGWTESLRLLRPEDRFNVVSFRDKARFCFNDWAPVNKTNLQTATGFIASLHSSGGTDLYESLREAMKLPLSEERPAIALVVTDGHPTLGTTQSSDIIGEFTADNQGLISVFTLGTQKTANNYLLDMLAFSNRGKGTIVEGGRWNIDQAIEDLVRQVSRPLLNNVRYQFDSDSGVDAYPSRSMNLYEDQPLRLFGRCPAETSRLVFQVRGTARDVTCDMIFNIDLREAETVRGDALQTRWAHLKMYDLIMNYTMNRDPGILDQMRTIHRAYGIPIPYSSEFR